MKKYISFMMILAMVLCMLPSAAMAWDGGADTSWYNDTDTEFVLTTADQLAGLADLVDAGNTFQGKTIKLGANIDLGGTDINGDPISFDPIGYGYSIVFKGTFDGQGYAITNLYQNGWALGLSYSTAGGGLFASAVDATFKNLRIDNAEIVMECIDMGILVGYSYGNCSYENITVTNSLIANYNRYTGGVVGEVNGTQTFKNVDVKDTTVSTLWGSFDTSLGGIVGGKYGTADVTFEGCDVACIINAYNDCTSAYEWHAYRRAGMLIGNTEESTGSGGTAIASWLTIKDCTAVYEDWANYTYCKFSNMNYPWVRVEAGYSADAYYNARYGHPKDANGNEVVDENHVHAAGDPHHELKRFEQLYGGGQGVYGSQTHTNPGENGPTDEMSTYDDFDELRAEDPDNDLFNIPDLNPAPAPAAPAGKDYSITYNGGNSFSTNRKDVPTSVEIDGQEVSFVGDGRNFTVGCIPANAQRITVRWNTTSITVNFKPDATVQCTEVEIPKTGDMPLWAAVAAIFGF